LPGRNSGDFYVPLGYWRHVEKDEDMLGRKGGRIVTLENIRRRFDNTAFAHLVRDGWVGTSPQLAMLLGSILAQIMKEGRAAIIAIENLKTPPADDPAESHAFSA
jgi:hypothetical protein